MDEWIGDGMVDETKLGSKKEKNGYVVETKERI